MNILEVVITLDLDDSSYVKNKLRLKVNFLLEEIWRFNKTVFIFDCNVFEVYFYGAYQFK